jgi:GntR family histidine utilization transcriptional repressor
LTTLDRQAGKPAPTDRPASTAGAGASTPTYLRIKEEVLDRVRTGKWQPGQSIPGDAEIARMFDCARMTAHRALRELAEEGVLERRRRTGSRVALRSGRSALVEIPRIDREIEAQGAVYGYQLLGRSLRRSTAAARTRLGLAKGDRTLWLLCLHWAGAVPFQLEERWINLQAAPAAEAEPFVDLGPNRWLLEHVPWSSAEHEISAELASPRASKHLRVAPGSALLVLERTTTFERRKVTYVRLSHPANTYKLRAAMQAAGRSST